MFTEISVNDINDFRLGHASNKEAGTGVTVIYFPDGATARSEERCVGKECRSRWSPYH